MILFPAYLAAVWIPAFVYRRTLAGFLIALLGPIPVMLSAWLFSLLAPSMSLMEEPWWITLYALAAAATGLGALVIACAPRHARAHECPACHYDLRGNVTGVCPECGTMVSETLLHGGEAEVAVSDPSVSDGRADPRAA